MTTVLDRFLRYVKIHTTSQRDVDEIPSTKRQYKLANLLGEELYQLGLTDTVVDEHCYVLATLPSNLPDELSKDIPVICLLAHIDTSPEEPGENVKPQIIENYDGGTIILHNNLIISPQETPKLKKYIGYDIITSDGTTLLGADDKAGVASIMTVIATLVNDPTIKHGTVKIVFTPDEEIGRGVDALNIQSLNADIGYTIDGGEMGELSSENFNAAGGTISITGFNLHPGYAKNKMVNAARIMGEIITQFPKMEAPETTEKREGFYHILEAQGNVNRAKIKFSLRDFDLEKLHQRMKKSEDIIEQVRLDYPKAKIKLDLKKEYMNMQYEIDKVPFAVEYAKEAIKRAGIEVIYDRIRGGTDGAKLSYQGLPTPNLFSGSINVHSKTEFIPVVALEKSVETILNLIQIYVEKTIGLLK